MPTIRPQPSRRTLCFNRTAGSTSWRTNESLFQAQVTNKLPLARAKFVTLSAAKPRTRKPSKHHASWLRRSEKDTGKQDIREINSSGDPHTEGEKKATNRGRTEKTTCPQNDIVRNPVSVHWFGRSQADPSASNLTTRTYKGTRWALDFLSPSRLCFAALSLNCFIAEPCRNSRLSPISAVCEASESRGMSSSA